MIQLPPINTTRDHASSVSASPHHYHSPMTNAIHNLHARLHIPENQSKSTHRGRPPLHNTISASPKIFGSPKHPAHDLYKVEAEILLKYILFYCGSMHGYVSLRAVEDLIHNPVEIVVESSFYKHGTLLLRNLLNIVHKAHIKPSAWFQSISSGQGTYATVEENSLYASLLGLTVQANSAFWKQSDLNDIFTFLANSDTAEVVTMHDFEVAMKKLKLSEEGINDLNHTAKELMKLSNFLRAQNVSITHFQHSQQHVQDENLTRALMKSELASFRAFYGSSNKDDESSGGIVSMVELEGMLIRLLESYHHRCRLDLGQVGTEISSSLLASTVDAATDDETRVSNIDAGSTAAIAHVDQAVAEKVALQDVHTHHLHHHQRYHHPHKAAKGQDEEEVLRCQNVHRLMQEKFLDQEEKVLLSTFSVTPASHHHDQYHSQHQAEMFYEKKDDDEEQEEQEQRVLEEVQVCFDSTSATNSNHLHLKLPGVGGTLSAVVSPRLHSSSSVISPRLLASPPLTIGTKKQSLQADHELYINTRASTDTIVLPFRPQSIDFLNKTAASYDELE